MKSGLILLLCLWMVGCSPEPPPAKLIQTISLEDAVKTKNWSGFLEGLQIVPPEVPVNKKDLSALSFFLVQTHHLAATGGKEPLTISKASNIFRTVDATLKKNRRWMNFVEQNKLVDRVGVLAMGNAIEEWGDRGGSEKNSSETSINAALERLQQRTNDDSFVIVEDPKSKRYVQFSCDKSKSLIFSFPIQTVSLGKGPIGEGLKYGFSAEPLPTEGITRVLLTEDEVGRLIALLERNGLIHSRQRQVGYNASGIKKSYLESVEGYFPSVSEGDRFVRDVFKEVYLQHSPDDFIISEN